MLLCFENLFVIQILWCNEKTPRKWQKHNLVSVGRLRGSQLWAGHELGGSAPHQCRWAVVVWAARCRDCVMPVSCCRLCLFLCLPVLHMKQISLKGGDTTASRGEVRSFRGVKSGYSRSRCSAVVPGVLVYVHMYMLYVCVYICVCMCVREHAYVYISAYVYL